MRIPLACLGLVLGLVPLAARAETAVFAGGCFWCVESDMDKVTGVRKTTSGFAGGDAPDPTYKNRRGHMEAVQVEFDPAVISYEELAAHFLRTIDVTDGGGQFCDRGGNYLSGLFPLDAAQTEAANRVLREAVASLGEAIATEIRTRTKFHPAGGEHQDYYLGTGRVLTRFGLIRQSAAYKKYREACGHDARVREVWGPQAYTFVTP